MAKTASEPTRASSLVPVLAWIAAISLVIAAAYLGWRTYNRQPSRSASANSSEAASVQKNTAPIVEARRSSEAADMPALLVANSIQWISRYPNLHTTIPKRPSLEVKDYVVDTGDSVFEIAAKFDIKPETVLWANYEQLNDNPDLISLGMELNIPPVNGVYYKWESGDTIESVAARFETKPDDILNWAGNHIDLTNPVVEPGQFVMVPNGHREFRQWIIPTIPRGRAGVSRSVYGAGACDGGYDGAYGSGTFIWPAGNHYLSGNDYWSGHLGIDIAAGEGAPIYAADSGVVVFSGWATGGYGYTILIDHGNGYQTLYGHMSSLSAGCGRSVGQGGVIGYSGSTGNSTGAHLHFEVRYQGGFVNPWYVLPAP